MGNKTKIKKRIWRKGDIVIYNRDFLKIEEIPENSVDLIITSPPYNVDIKYNSFNDEIPYNKYLEFTEKWLKKAYDLAKDDGRFCLNIPLDKNKGGQQSVYADITSIAKKVGWRYHSTIIWNEQNISRRTAWGSWRSASAPYVIAPVEMIVLLYKNKWKKTGGSKKNTITKKQFIDWTNGFWTYNNLDKIWTFPGESKKRIGHPAPFPIELPKRCIKLFSYSGDTVLDPFLGSGTTLVASNNLKRRSIGVENDRRYFNLSIKRIKKEARFSS